MSLDPTLCPRCGKPNACAMATGSASDATLCWCERFTFSKAVLARVPKAQRGTQCLCLACSADVSKTGAGSIQ